MNTILVSKFYAIKSAGTTKSDQIWCIKDNILCKMLYNQQLTKSICTSGGETAVQGDERPGYPHRAPQREYGGWRGI